MTISELIERLNEWKNVHGDLEVVIDAPQYSGYSISKNESVFSYEQAAETKEDSARYPGLLRIEVE